MESAEGLFLVSGMTFLYILAKVFAMHIKNFGVADDGTRNVGPAGEGPRARGGLRSAVVAMLSRSRSIEMPGGVQGEGGEGGEGGEVEFEAVRGDVLNAVGLAVERIRISTTPQAFKDAIDELIALVNDTPGLKPSKYSDLSAKVLLPFKKKKMAEFGAEYDESCTKALTSLMGAILRRQQEADDDKKLTATQAPLVPV